MAIRGARTPAQTERTRQANRTIGAAIRRQRRARGWTIEQAAEAIELDARHLQRVEVGRVSPSAATLVRIADALGVPVAILVEGVEPVRDLADAPAAPPSPESPALDVATVPRAVGRRIAELRKERGQSQAQLGAAAGITEQYVQRVESGRQNPSVKVLAQVARALGISLSGLVAVEQADSRV